MRVYKGEQPFADFLRLQTQGALFERPVTQRHSVVNKLAVAAAKVVGDLGPHADWTDLKAVMKTRIAGRVVCDPDDILTSLESAMRMRKQP